MKLLEKIIGQLIDKIDVILVIDKTKHAAERQSRHGKDDFIEEQEIMSVANKSIEQVAKLLMFDKLDIGDKIHIHDKKSNLNLIGLIQNNGQRLQIKIITVMRKRDFKSSGTYTIEVN
ncbi:MAG: hypothetical protein H8E98_06085 [Bacteroidetes bacterium]|nr:hypothetical protein [Bacteroidota bacterium]